MLHKFIEISKGEEQNYLNAGYFVVTNISNDWIYLTNNLHYVRAETIAAVAELDVSLEKQESKGLITILRSEKVEVVPEEKPANENLKKLKKTIKSDNNADVSELLETASEEEPKIPMKQNHWCSRKLTLLIFLMKIKAPRCKKQHDILLFSIESNKSCDNNLNK